MMFMGCEMLVMQAVQPWAHPHLGIPLEEGTNKNPNAEAAGAHGEDRTNLAFFDLRCIPSKPLIPNAVSGL